MVRQAMVRQGPAALPVRQFPARPSDFQTFIDDVVELAKTLTGASGSAIALCSERGIVCVANSGQGAPPVSARVDISSGISRRCLDSGTALWSEDLATDGFDLHMSDAAEVRAVAVVPIFRGDDVFGILGIFSLVPRVFSDLHLRWLQQMAGWVGSAETISNDGQTDRISSHQPHRPGKSPGQIHLWNDVFVETRLPWKRFAESAFLHAVAVLMCLGVSKITPRVTVTPLKRLREAHIVYYPAQSFPAYQSSRPSELPRQRYRSSDRHIVAKSHDLERTIPNTREAVDARRRPEVALPSAEMPIVTRRHFPNQILGSAVSPAPEIPKAEIHQPRLPQFAVVAPPPELTSHSGSRRSEALKSTVVPPSPEIHSLSTGSSLSGRGQIMMDSTGGVEITVVAPTPSLNDRAILTHRAAAAGTGVGEQVVPAPPTIHAGIQSGAVARGLSVGDGIAPVVPPAPSLEEGNSLGHGRGAGTAAMDGTSQVVPPPPSIQGDSNSARRGGLGHSEHIATQVVPPPPSVETLREGHYGAGGRVASLANKDSDRVSPTTSIESGSKVDARSATRRTDSFSAEGGIDQSHLRYGDVQLRVIGLAWAPPSSSYFSNFEVFIAEKWLSKTESQFIKLVYIFLPYQRRLSEYGADALKAHRLRVARDSTCDESLSQMMWPGDKGAPVSANHSGEGPASSSSDMLPCYVTTADDYRHAISRSH